MKTYFEKAEKLNVILKRLKSFDLSKIDNRDGFNDLISQKNQLEIEKKDLEIKFEKLADNVYRLHGIQFLM